MLPSKEHIISSELLSSRIKMDAQETKQAFSVLNLKQMGSKGSRRRNDQVIVDGEDEVCGSTDSSSSSSSYSLPDLTEDELSSSSASSSSDGPLFDLSEFMAHLPIKRGLSKFYEGKSQSFTSLASVESIEDLVKKECSKNTHRMRMKSRKSFGGALDQSQ